MLGLIADSVIEDILVVLEQDFNPSKVVVAVSGAEAQAALCQASVDHAVVLEPVRLPEDHATYSSQINLCLDLGRPRCQAADAGACTAA